ncbi:putative exocyst complex component Exo70, cullin repeat-like-containing domain superfamily [Helianthus annuus]|uniref:exocyst complex component EXO70B1-like n=1 Tax=Helianthus annuus TaxID=4232 RepID=UPI000B902E38|nr:exocyst complex component EXO70B1-like [Helianthus annuus]KAJ0701487.1 putative exocyst complex component Exo70, cullin repeat-like-containing domain superfamily [Helianthus annuus]
MTTDSATAIIHRWRSTTDHNLFIFHNHREQIAPFLQAVDEIQRTIDFTASEDERKHAKSVIQIAVSRLTDEFRNILKVNAKSTSSLNPNSHTDSTTMTDSASSNYQVYEDDYINHNKLSTDAVNDLRTIVVRMNSSGFVNECLKVYVSERKKVIGACLQHLNVEKLSKSSCRSLEWGVLEVRIRIWIKAVKVCFKYYFENEKRLCEQVFCDLGDETVGSCLVDTITEYTVQLLDTAEALSSIRPASERLFKMLDVHDTLSDLIPSINGLFRSELSEFIRTKAKNEVLPKLGDKANEILLRFENDLVNEQSPVVHAEPIHRLSKYVMHYVYKLCDHKQSLMRLSLPDPPSMEAAGTISGSFSLHVVWIIMRLLSNLEAKSKLGKDTAAGRFFAMNNFHYIIQKIQARPELLEIVADDNFNKLIDKFEQARLDYLKLTFDVVSRNLSDKGLSRIKILPFRVAKLADRLKRFNYEFEKLEKELGKVVVPDFGLVLELRKLIVEMVVTAYTSFLVHTKKVARLETYVKYSVEEIESAIQGFYDCR